MCASVSEVWYAVHQVELRKFQRYENPGGGSSSTCSCSVSSRLCILHTEQYTQCLHSPALRGAGSRWTCWQEAPKGEKAQMKGHRKNWNTAYLFIHSMLVFPTCLSAQNNPVVLSGALVWIQRAFCRIHGDGGRFPWLPWLGIGDIQTPEG